MRPTPSPRPAPPSAAPWAAWTWTSARGVGLTAAGLPDIDWVPIPGGDFIYQHGKRRRIAAFHIARFPVTNTQYQAFLAAADGYPDDRWWQGLTDPERSPGQPGWDLPNHPRETVSWHEAMAFCA